MICPVSSVCSSFEHHFKSTDFLHQTTFFGHDYAMVSNISLRYACDDDLSFHFTNHLLSLTVSDRMTV